MSISLHSLGLETQLEVIYSVFECIIRKNMPCSQQDFHISLLTFRVKAVVVRKAR